MKGVILAGGLGKRLEFPQRQPKGILEGFWSDDVTFDSLLRANNLVAEKERNKG